MQEKNDRTHVCWPTGCSAMAWSTGDGKHLWGRNLDYSRLAEETRVCYFPRGTAYATCVPAPEHDAAQGRRCSSAYAAAGVGLSALPDSPILYEGINEKGLMGASSTTGNLHTIPMRHDPKRMCFSPRWPCTICWRSVPAWRRSSGRSNRMSR